MAESQEVDAKPYLESQQHECGKNAHSGLKKSALVAEDGTDSCTEKHDEHYKVRELLIVSDVDFRSHGSYDGCHTAEEHR